MKYSAYYPNIEQIINSSSNDQDALKELKEIFCASHSQFTAGDLALSLKNLIDKDYEDSIEFLLKEGFKKGLLIDILKYEEDGENLLEKGFDNKNFINSLIDIIDINDTIILKQLLEIENTYGATVLYSTLINSNNVELFSKITKKYPEFTKEAFFTTMAVEQRAIDAAVESKAHNIIEFIVNAQKDKTDFILSERILSTVIENRDIKSVDILINIITKNDDIKIVADDDDIKEALESLISDSSNMKEIQPLKELLVKIGLLPISGSDDIISAESSPEATANITAENTTSTNATSTDIEKNYSKYNKNYTITDRIFEIMKASSSEKFDHECYDITKTWYNQLLPSIFPQNKDHTSIFNEHYKKLINAVKYNCEKDGCEEFIDFNALRLSISCIDDLLNKVEKIEISPIAFPIDELSVTASILMMKFSQKLDADTLNLIKNITINIEKNIDVNDDKNNTAIHYTIEEINSANFIENFIENFIDSIGF